jgi:hypothetical protein
MNIEENNNKSIKELKEFSFGTFMIRFKLRKMVKKLLNKTRYRMLRNMNEY